MANTNKDLIRDQVRGTIDACHNEGWITDEEHLDIIHDFEYYFEQQFNIVEERPIEAHDELTKFEEMGGEFYAA